MSERNGSNAPHYQLQFDATQELVAAQQQSKKKTKIQVSPTIRDTLLMKAKPITTNEMPRQPISLIEWFLTRYYDEPDLRETFDYLDEHYDRQNGTFNPNNLIWTRINDVVRNNLTGTEGYNDGVNRNGNKPPDHELLILGGIYATAGLAVKAFFTGEPINLEKSAFKSRLSHSTHNRIHTLLPIAYQLTDNALNVPIILPNEEEMTSHGLNLEATLGIRGNFGAALTREIVRAMQRRASKELAKLLTPINEDVLKQEKPVDLSLNTFYLEKQTGLNERPVPGMYRRRAHAYSATAVFEFQKKITGQPTTIFTSASNPSSQNPVVYISESAPLLS